MGVVSRGRALQRPIHSFIHSAKTHRWSLGPRNGICEWDAGIYEQNDSPSCHEASVLAGLCIGRHDKK
jgi:hypothetical protein